MQRYDYATETNYCNMGDGQVAAGGGGSTLTSYVRAGRLTKISYGYRLAEARAGNAPAARVLFTAAQRCVTSDTVCQASNPSDAGGTIDPVTGVTGKDTADAGELQAIMWLSAIQHTGLDTGAGATGTLALDPVTFEGVETGNRVDGLTPTAPPLYHYSDPDHTPGSTLWAESETTVPSDRRRRRWSTTPRRTGR